MSIFTFCKFYFHPKSHRFPHPWQVEPAHHTVLDQSSEVFSMFFWDGRCLMTFASLIIIFLFITVKPLWNNLHCIKSYRSWADLTWNCIKIYISANSLVVVPVCSDWVSAGAGRGQCNQRCRPGRAGHHAHRSQSDYLHTPSSRWTAPSTSHARLTTPSHLQRKHKGWTMNRIPGRR